jgi:hypothetical protein
LAHAEFRPQRGRQHGAASAVSMQPIRGTFLDMQYDGRLKYANNVSTALTCTQWADKVNEFGRVGIRFLIFQAVHDDRFGAYYNSSLHSVWKGQCSDVIGTVMKAAIGADIKIWLSCEFAHTDADGVTDPALMAGRRAIMTELVEEGYTSLSSFYGWYFSSEAYLTSTPACASCFPDVFMAYINTMAGWSHKLTPGAKRFVSPFGTRIATAAPNFVAQLQKLDVDVVAYQDEVGCVRDEWPQAMSKAAFTALHEAHSHPNTPALWANIESFTWETYTNNVQSALIPASFPRILSQLQAVSPLVDKVITFTAQAIYQPPPHSAMTNASWGPPNAVREWEAYTSTLGLTGSPAPSLSQQLVLAGVQGRVDHAAVGWHVSFAKDSAPDPTMAHGDLTDGLTGGQTPWDRRWVGFNPGKDAAVVLELPLDAPPLLSVGAHFLAVPPLWFTNGDHTKPVARNLTSWLPSKVQWAGSADGTTWQELGLISHTDWWAREVYDIRTEAYVQHLSGPFSSSNSDQKFRYLRMTATNAPPPWWADWYNERVKGAGGLSVGRLMVDELVVNFGS